MTVKKKNAIWYTCRVNERAPEGTIQAQIRVPEDSPWFDGHFPDGPLLPGVAQLAMVHDLLCRVSAQRLAVEQVSRVRFKQMIRPDQTLELSIHPGSGPDGYRFRIDGDDGLICSGLVRLSADHPSSDGP